MQFFEEKLLKLLWLVPLVLAFFYMTSRHKKHLISLFSNVHTFRKLSVGHSRIKSRFRSGFMLLALTCLILSLARPQWGEEMRSLKRKGVDIVFILDTSMSMLSEDVRPNRIKAAKRSMSELVERLTGDRIGLVAFAGTSFLQVPLTLDYSAFRLFLDAVDVGFIPDAGSDLRQAFFTACRAFDDTDKKDHRVVIIYSDGESHEGSTDELLKMAKEADVRVYAIGVATKKGAPIPLRSGETGEASGYKKDRSGQTVITKLEDETLKRLSAETGGLYYTATPAKQETKLIFDDLQSIDKRELKEETAVAREERYQLFLALGLIFFALSSILGERKGFYVS